MLGAVLKAGDDGQEGCETSNRSARPSRRARVAETLVASQRPDTVRWRITSASESPATFGEEV